MMKDFIQLFVYIGTFTFLDWLIYKASWFRDDEKDRWNWAGAILVGLVGYIIIDLVVGFN